tara:strand:+ start:705 stop:1076 length:372 start_codon:yes stop_codon:yes gene_type:complete
MPNELCPVCHLENVYADEIGAVDWPRSWHAGCGHAVSDALSKVKDMDIFRERGPELSANEEDEFYFNLKQLCELDVVEELNRSSYYNLGSLEENVLAVAEILARPMSLSDDTVLGFCSPSRRV